MAPTRRYSPARSSGGSQAPPQACSRATGWFRWLSLWVFYRFMGYGLLGWVGQVCQWTLSTATRHKFSCLLVQVDWGASKRFSKWHFSWSKCECWLAKALVGGSQSIAMWFFKVFWLLVNHDARIHWSLAVKYNKIVIKCHILLWSVYLHNLLCWQRPFTLTPPTDIWLGQTKSRKMLDCQQ